MRSGPAADSSRLRRIETIIPSVRRLQVPRGYRVKIRIPVWLGRLGVVGFLFFLVKGLLWLAIPSLIAMDLLK